MDRQLTEMERYVVEEHIEDFEDGFIGRRELLRRVGLIVGGSAATLGVLTALGCNVDAPAARSAAPAAAAAAASASATAAARSASPSPSAAALPYASPPAARTTDGVTVQENDPRIVAGKASVRAADGASLIGYFARPSAAGTYPGVVVIHENRGLTDHIRDVTRRYATAGFAAVAIDILSRSGGADKLTDAAAYAAELAKRSLADQVSDERAALEFLKAQPQVAPTRLGMTGFCFGGGITFACVSAGLDLRAAVPYYGPKPGDIAGLATTKTAVYAVYGKDDVRVSAGWADIEPVLKRSGAPYGAKEYVGANHAFHNDTGERYAPEQARAAWVDTIEWFRKYL